MFEICVAIEKIDFGSVVTAVIPKAPSRQDESVLDKLIGKVNQTVSAVVKEASAAGNLDGIAMGALRLFQNAIIARLNEMFHKEGLGITVDGITMTKLKNGEFVLQISVANINYQTLLKHKLPLILEKVSSLNSDGMEGKFFRLIGQIPPEAFEKFISDIPSHIREEMIMLLIESNGERIIETITQEAESRNIKIKIRSVTVRSTTSEIP
jgi:hypothetical protein